MRFERCPRVLGRPVPWCHAVLAVCLLFTQLGCTKAATAHPDKDLVIADPILDDVKVTWQGVPLAPAPRFRELAPAAEPSECLLSDAASTGAGCR